MFFGGLKLDFTSRSLLPVSAPLDHHTTLVTWSQKCLGRHQCQRLGLKLYVMLKLMVVILEFCSLLISTNLTDFDIFAKLIIVSNRGKRCWGGFWSVQIWLTLTFSQSWSLWVIEEKVLGRVLISVNSLWHATASLSVNGEHAKELAKQH